jgi:GTP pyrophosphokinase
VSKIISEELKVNMSSISFSTDHGIFRGEIMLYVNDTRHLEMLISKLEKVEGVVTVARFDSKTN